MSKIRPDKYDKYNKYSAEDNPYRHIFFSTVRNSFFVHLENLHSEHSEHSTLEAAMKRRDEVEK